MASIAPKLGACYTSAMRIISLKPLRAFWAKHPLAERPLRAWYAETKHAIWKSPADIKKVYKNVSIVANNRVIFNVKGNDYRVVVAINYPVGIVYIRFVGTHAQYDKINVEII